MPGIAGKKNRLQVSTTAGGAGTYTTVAGLKSCSIEIDGAAVDDSEFGIDWTQRLQGIKDFKITASGNYRGSDTLGQVAILSAMLNDTVLWAKILPDNGTTVNIGFKGQVVVTKFSLEPVVDGAQPVSIELSGTGA